MLDIDESYLSGDGVEKDPHVTILCGIDMEKFGSPENLEYIKSEIEKSGILPRTFNGNRLSLFQNEDKDVLKIDFVESSVIKKLRKLNELFTKQFEVVSDFPDYKPHSTVAYLQKGKGKEFKQKLQTLIPFKVKKAVFSSKKSESDEKYITKDLIINRSIVAKDYVKRELF